MKGSKIKRINIIYPDTEEMLQMLYTRYNKALAKVLIDTLPEQVIDMLISELEYKERGKNTISS